MNIKTFMAAAVVALTAACSDQATEPAPVNVGPNPADRDHSEQREQNQPGPHAPLSK